MNIIKRKVINVLIVLCAATALFIPRYSHSLVTPFGIRVNDSIDLGLQWLRNNQNPDGGWGEGTGLAVLCFLEKRQSEDWSALPQGYDNLSQDDQQRVKSGIKYCVQQIPGFEQAGVNSYQTGACLMAMSTYLATMGPDNVGANTAVSSAIATGVQRLKNMQGISGQNSPNDGGFDYNSRNDRGDMSTTQFAMAGLFAAERILPGSSNTLSLSRGFINNTQGVNGGHSYSAFGNSDNHAMTASGAWTYLLSGLPVEDVNVQAALEWLKNNYINSDNNRLGSRNSFYYYLWASAKAFEVSVGNQPNKIYADQIGGTLDTTALGYPEESPRWYFDYAWFLINDQGPEGNWCSNGNIRCWSGSAPATSYALLVLLRSLGGVCLLDEDEDELCEADDNCPTTPNPDQLDTDGDGVGDVCDNCWDVPNPDQVDDDIDGIGDLCDDIVCIPDGLTDLCDGIDNDCDASIDEEAPSNSDVDEANMLCATGLPGVCARGTEACINGEVLCVPQQNVSEEVCDSLDNNCNGIIDEGVSNSCGGCGEVDEEVCNGEDEDCDGVVDESDNICGERMSCYNSECRHDCDIECPDSNLWCDTATNLCLSPCESIECDFGDVCDDNSFMCFDPCDNISCPEVETRCWGGECVLDICLYTGCQDGSICDGIECIPDPCASVECEADNFCREGQCIPSCSRISCALYETCFDGLCVDSPCGGVQCTDTEICEEGNCINNECLNITCQENETCLQGECTWDRCTNIQCPAGQSCEIVNNEAQCIQSWTSIDHDTNSLPTGGSEAISIEGGEEAGVIESMGGLDNNIDANKNPAVTSFGCIQSSYKQNIFSVFLFLLAILTNMFRRKRKIANRLHEAQDFPISK